MSEAQPLSVCVRDALGTFEAFRRLGFSSDDILLAFQDKRVCVILRAQELEFVVTLEPDPKVRTRRQFCKAMERGAQFWNDPSNDSECAVIWSEWLAKVSVSPGGSAGLLRGLQAKGFILPIQAAAAFNPAEA